MQFDGVVDEVFEVFDRDTTEVVGKRDDETSRAISTLAVLYEKARNAIEYRAEHFVRRAAIERILKRRVLTDKVATKIAENLTVELLWARYIDSSFLDGGKGKQIEIIIARYLLLKNKLDGYPKKNSHWDLLLGCAASEIDELIVAPTKREALVKLFYLAVRPRIVVPDINEEKLDMYVYVCVEKALVQADEKLITYHLLRMSSPNWFSYKENGEDLSHQLLGALGFISENINDSLVARIYPFVRNQLPTVLLLRDFLLEHAGETRVIAENESELDEVLKQSADKAGKETKRKIKRAMFRSFIYIFLTKMLFALLLELPYDLYIAKQVLVLPLAINTLFPPLLLIALSTLFILPGKQNTKRLVAKTKTAIYDFAEYAKEGPVFDGREDNKRPVLTTFFYILYLAGFVVTFGVINNILARLDFNLISRVIFVFFAALVTFFAYHIRSSAKEYQLEKRQGILASLFDFIFLPILRAGQILSGGIAKLNMLVFVFDFILEAPLKTIFEVLEEWFRFIRTKREEII